MARMTSASETAFAGAAPAGYATIPAVPIRMLTSCFTYCMTDSVAEGSPAAAASFTAPSLSSRSAAVAALSVPRMVVVGMASSSKSSRPPFIQSVNAAMRTAVTSFVLAN